jgi:hypothetical protein
MIRSFTSWVVFTALLCIPVYSQVQPPADLAQAMRERDQAIDKADAATWDRLTGDDFTVVMETGRLMTKAERLAEIRKAKPTGLQPCQRERMQVYDDTAVERCRHGNIRVMTVWVKSQSGWRAAAVQVTTVPGS